MAESINNIHAGILCKRRTVGVRVKNGPDTSANCEFYIEGNEPVEGSLA